jgi:hypothetical protein
LVVEMILLIAIGALAVVGAATGIVLVARQGLQQGALLEADSMTPRVVAEVRAGEEQVLIHLARSLTLPSGREDVAYGEIYIAGSAGMTMRLASRSEIGRGFEGEVRVHRTRRASMAEYYILRLPGDETLHPRIAALDDEIAHAFTTLDPHAQIRRGPGGRGPGSAAVA